MPHTVNEWLTLIAAVWGALSVLIVWGFASGKFLQKRDDTVDDLRRRVAALADRVAHSEGRLNENDKARHAFIERVNTDLGRLRHKYELMHQRMEIDEKHGDERHERIDAEIERIGEHLVDLKRHIDNMRAGNDPPDRRRR